MLTRTNRGILSRQRILVNVQIAENTRSVFAPFCRVAVSPFRPSLSLVSDEIRKARRKNLPNLILDLVCCARPVDQYNTTWFAFSQRTIAFANTLVEVSGLLLHAIGLARPLHS